MLERLEVIEKIGQGGMAIVYRGYLNGNYGFKKEIVVKKILTEHFDNERYLDMFVDEASISAQLNHSNIVQVFDFFEEANELHILMEFVNGGTLRDLMVVNKEANLFIPLEHVLYIINNLLNGMDFYHNKRDIEGKHLGIIHRDLTPKNVLVSIYGEVKISDFGIAKFEDKKDLTSFGEVKGKPSYMSPEQIKLLPNLDNRVDLFSLGVMFYELLTNQHPFREGNIYQTQQNIMNGKYTLISDIRDDLPPEVEKIVYKLLKVDRDKRYLSAGLVKKDLLNLEQRISTQLVFSRYATELLQPGYVNYIQSILPDVHSRSDFRMIKRKENKTGIFENKKILIGSVAALFLINIIFLIFTLVKSSNASDKLLQAKLKAKEVKEQTIRDQRLKDEEARQKKEKEQAEEKARLRAIEEAKKEEVKKAEEAKQEEAKKLAEKEKLEKEKAEKEAALAKARKRKTPRKVTKVKKAVQKATIDVYVIPFGDIFVDGKKISSVTKLGYKIPSGRHKIVIKDMNGKTRAIKIFNIKPEEKKEFRFNLN